jgi:alcohol dehydrogenase, propanol-preferring
VFELARAGLLDVHVERFGIEDAPEAYRRLHDGKSDGRAVILPNG